MTPARPSYLLPAIAVALCGAMWGMFWLPLRWFENSGVGPVWLSIVFNLTTMLVALVFMRDARAWAGINRQAIVGLCLGTAFTLYTVSLLLTDVINAILLFYLTPVWSTIGGWLLFRERLTGQRIAAIILGFAGLLLILGLAEGIPYPRNLGDWMALASGVLWSAGSLMTFSRPSRNIALTVFTFGAGGFLFSLLLLALSLAFAPELANSGSLVEQLIWIVLLALVIFVPPNFLVLWATQRMDPGRVGILLMTEVVVGAVSAALMSGEHFSGTDLAGTMLIIAAGLIEVLGRR